MGQLKGTQVGWWHRTCGKGGIQLALEGRLKVLANKFLNLSVGESILGVGLGIFCRENFHNKGLVSTQG